VSGSLAAAGLHCHNSSVSAAEVRGMRRHGDMYPRVQRPSIMCYQLVAQSVETIKRINPRLKLECTRSSKPTNNRSNNKYQLPLSDPHDRIVDRARRSAQQTTVVEHRSSEVLSTQLTDDGPVYYALSVHLSRAKLITRFDDQYDTIRDASLTCARKPT